MVNILKHPKKVYVTSGRKKETAWDAFLVYAGLKEESLAVRVNKRLMSGTKSSPMAKRIVGKVSSKKFNEMMSKAVASYNEDHNEKIFNE